MIGVVDDFLEVVRPSLGRPAKVDRSNGPTQRFSGVILQETVRKCAEFSELGSFSLTP